MLRYFGVSTQVLVDLGDYTAEDSERGDSSEGGTGGQSERGDDDASDVGATKQDGGERVGGDAGTNASETPAPNEKGKDLMVERRETLVGGFCETRGRGQTVGVGVVGERAMVVVPVRKREGEGEGAERIDDSDGMCHLYVYICLTVSS